MISVRFNGLATLATTSFTCNLICDVICLTLMWWSYNTNENLARALTETFSGWYIWWKWIAIFSTLSSKLLLPHLNIRQNVSMRDDAYKGKSALAFT